MFSYSTSTLIILNHLTFSCLIHLIFFKKALSPSFLIAIWHIISHSFDPLLSWRFKLFIYRRAFPTINLSNGPSFSLFLLVFLSLSSSSYPCFFSLLIPSSSYPSLSLIVPLTLCLLLFLAHLIFFCSSPPYLIYQLIYICLSSSVYLHLPIFICLSSSIYLHLSIFICLSSSIYLHLSIFICLSSFAYLHLPIFINVSVILGDFAGIYSRGPCVGCHRRRQTSTTRLSSRRCHVPMDVSIVRSI